MDNPTILPKRYQMDVFNVPELCNRIFGFADKASLARCACVCTALSDCALDNLWRKLNNLRPLFGILPPLEEDKNGSLHFSTKPRRHDWERFQSYALRVRDLSLSSLSSDLILELSEETLMQIYHKRLTMCLTCLTPKLTSLSVSGTWEDVVFDFSVLCMSDSLVYLSIDFYLIRDVSEFFKEVAARAPHLKRLELFNGWHLEQIGMEVAELLPQLSMLEVVHLPARILTSQVVKALLCLPQIRELSWRREYEGFRYILFALSPSPHDSFPHLTKLELMADIPDVTELIGFTPNLRSLQLWFRSFGVAGALHSFLEAVSHSCRSLISLWIDAFPSTWDNNSLDDFSRRERLTFPSKPFTFLPFPDLTTFTLLWPVPLMFNNGELVQFMSAFPIIQNLHLNCHPAMLEKPALTLDILPEIANTCPEIRSLALYVDCTIPPLDISESCATPVFKRLSVLDLGVSPTNGDIYVYFRYFSRLCGASCKLVSDYLNISETVAAKTLGKYGADYFAGTWRTNCGTMERLSRLFIEAQDEIRRSVTQENDAALQDKQAALEEKIVALESERDILMEKWKAAESENARLRKRVGDNGEGTVSDSTGRE